MVLSHDALVLAGGTGRRMGGANKPQVLLDGRRLLDHALEAAAGAGTVVVIAPGTVPVPDGVLRTLEEPPHGGPVAGVGAGLAALAEATPPAPWVLVLACDVPGAVEAVPRLLAAAARHDSGPTRQGRARPAGRPDATGPGRVDGVVARDGAGRAQWLVGLYCREVLAGRLADLAAGGGTRGRSVRELVRPMRLREVPVTGRGAVDIDTWEDLRAAASTRDNV